MHSNVAILSTTAVAVGERRDMGHRRHTGLGGTWVKGDTRDVRHAVWVKGDAQETRDVGHGRYRDHMIQDTDDHMKQVTG